ncbi:DNA polymerase epsilon subunit 4 isoform X1 [Monodon monoceros]|uniref:DNA polymerase epsilon subunit 4 isoform X1 n=1 Tax=Monodon monoceros TaxID=40151 RepID=UPI0010F43B92|nr:DNA polymerase epsilon subunit 4 isoform X1 [Monodon monoceros]
MAAVATGNGAFQEEEGTGGDAAAPQPHAPTSAPGARLSRLPLARVKALVKADPDVTLAGQEAIFILARAAELFVETIAKDAYCCAQQGKRKTLQRRDLDNAIEAVDEFAFLEGVAGNYRTCQQFHLECRKRTSTRGGRGVEGHGVHLSPQMRQEYNYKWNNSHRAPAEH